MISFSSLDFAVILLFFAAVVAIGFFAGRKKSTSAEDYLLSGRKVGLFLFVLTNVATWYGGILGVGEFTYRYGLLSWFTQGLPYYIFAIIFALFFAKKIREASLITIPDKLEKVYGKKVALIGSILLFVLVSPAPYLLMVGNLLSLIFNIDLLPSLIISFILSAAYLYTGGLRADIFTDAFEFFVMFAGFILIAVIAFLNMGDFNFLQNNLPVNHLKLTGGTSFTYVIVWFLIALWTFTDPGFHQRCYAAKDGNVAVKGIIISVLFWALFDFLTTTTGLYARAAIPNLTQPVLAFPLLAEKLLGSGLKGVFYAAMFATILSTLNSFLFLSATTFSNDFLFRFKKIKDEKKLKSFTAIGLTVTGVLSIILAYIIPSVIELWYSIGTICIPGLILPVVAAYYPALRINKGLIIVEIISGFSASLIFLLLKMNYPEVTFLNNIEPMIIGILCALLIHFIGIILRYFRGSTPLTTI
ncbi:MAG: sodium:solute symporter family protein [Ignavibacteriales bacterium]|nr:sodium:solute symporter family protein [Ignavibacteriales bacterium]